MKLNLLSCDAQRPDKRAISKCITEISSQTNTNLAFELADILIEGDAVEIEVDDKNTASALRALRKLDIDYEIID
jgi:positive regulator of sigma E activity